MAEETTGGRGFPPVPPENLRRFVGCYIEPQKWNELEAWAQERGISRGALLRELIDAALARRHEAGPVRPDL